MTESSRIESLHASGLVDMHYDLLMDLYEKRRRAHIIRDDYLADFRAGGMGVIAAAIYIEDKYLPEMALRVALGQIARLYAEADTTPEIAICRNTREIEAARAQNRIAFVITMEGVEPLGNDLNLLRVFYELGVRAIGLTHVRRTMAADGGVFAPSGSSSQGLTAFGRAVIQGCEALGILIDLAHINPAGFDDVLAITRAPLIVSHSNARRFLDIERNISDDQIRAIGARGGVIGVNSLLLSPNPGEITLDRYIDHIEYMVELAGIDSVAIGFDFFERIYKTMAAEDLIGLPDIHFPAELLHHGHARNVTQRLIARGWRDEDLHKFLHANWMRVLATVLK
jgi:membrane dipeptidase